MSNPYSGFTGKELRLLRSLNTPKKIVKFIDELDYNVEPNGDTAYSPKRVLEERKAHCLEAALFAACALRFNGFPPLIIDLRAVRDEDHVLCVFKQDGAWGCIAKSKFTGLRSREPVYASLRELAMSFFDDYFNMAGEKTLREYSEPMNLTQYDSVNWMDSREDLFLFEDALNALKHHRLIDSRQEKNLRRVRGVLFQAQVFDHPKLKKH